MALLFVALLGVSVYAHVVGVENSLERDFYLETLETSSDDCGYICDDDNQYSSAEDTVF